MDYDANMEEIFTTTRADEPRILLIAPTSRLSQRINHLFSQEHIQVQQLTPEAAVKHSNALQNEVFYKIVFVDMGMSSAMEEKLAVSLLQLLQNSQSPLLHLVSQSYGSESSKWLLSLPQTDQEALFSRINALFTTKQAIHQIVFTDYLDADHVVSPWQNCIQVRNQKLILSDPHIQFSPLSFETIKTILPQLLFSPIQARERQILSGTPYMSQQFFQEFNEYLEKTGRKTWDVIREVRILTPREYSDAHKKILLSELHDIFLEFHHLLTTIVATPFSTKATEETSLISRSISTKSVVKQTKTDATKTNITIVTQSKNKIWRNPLEDRPMTSKVVHERKPDNENTKEIEKTIQHIFQNERVEKKKGVLKDKIQRKKKVEKKNTKRKLFLFLSLFLFGIVFGCGLISLAFLGSKQYVAQAVEKQYAFFLAPNENQEPQTWPLVVRLMRLQLQAYRPLLPQATYKQSVDNLQQAEQLLEYQRDKRLQKVQTAKLLQAILTQQSNNEAFLTQQKQLLLSVQNTQEILLSLKLQTQETQNNTAIAALNTKIQANEARLALLEQLPELLGIPEEKQYLVLLQNDLQLTALGGKTEVAALLRFSHGSLQDAQVLDAYQIEGKLHGKEIATEEEQQVLQQSELNFFSQLWDPNTAASATQIQTELNQAFAANINGTVFLTLSGLQDVLGDMQAREIPNLSESISANNLIDRVLFYSDNALSEKLQQESFYSQFFKAFLSPTQLAREPEALLTGIDIAIQNKQLVLSLENSEAIPDSWQVLLQTPLCPGRLQSQACVVESFLQQETNIAANLSNHFITREISQEVTLQADSIYHERHMSFTNTSTSNAWPAGTYSAYLQFYLPENAQLQSISYQGEVLPAEKIMVKKQDNRLVYGYIITVPPQTTVTAELRFSTPVEQLPETYGFLEEKQLGKPSESLHFTIQYPPQLSPTLIAPEATVASGKVSFVELSRNNIFFLLQLQ